MAQRYAARSRTPGTQDPRRVVAHVQPHKERALWNFLTWSFFLAQILAVEQLLAGQANAAVNHDPAASDISSESAVVELDGMMADADEGGMTGEEAAEASRVNQGAEDSRQMMKIDRADEASIVLDAPPQAESQEAVQSEIVSSGQPSVSEEVPAEVVMPVFTADLQPDLIDVVGGTLDPVLGTIDDIIEALEEIVGDATDPLLGVVGDGLGAVVEPLLGTLQNVVKVVGDAGGDVIDIVEAVTEPLLGTVSTVVASLQGTIDGIAEPLLDGLQGTLPQALAAITGDLDDVIDIAVQPVGEIAGLAGTALDVLQSPVDLATSVVGDVLASPGALTFPALASTGLDDLFSGGSYTDYNLAIHEPLSLVSASATIDAAISSPAATVLALASDADADDLLDDLGDDLPLPHIVTSGLLDSGVFRGLGDGIV